MCVCMYIDGRVGYRVKNVRCSSLLEAARQKGKEKRKEKKKKKRASPGLCGALQHGRGKPFVVEYLPQFTSFCVICIIVF